MTKFGSLIMLVSLVAVGNALKCYECEEGCGEGNEPRLVSCSEGLDICVEIKDTKGKLIEEGCTTKQVFESCKALVKISGGECTSCNTDGCNGGVVGKLSTFALLAPVAVIAKYLLSDW